MRYITLELSSCHIFGWCQNFFVTFIVDIREVQYIQYRSWIFLRKERQLPLKLNNLIICLFINIYLFIFFFVIIIHRVNLNQMKLLLFFSLIFQQIQRIINFNTLLRLYSFGPSFSFLFAALLLFYWFFFFSFLGNFVPILIVLFIYHWIMFIIIVLIGLWPGIDISIYLCV